MNGVASNFLDLLGVGAQNPGSSVQFLLGTIPTTYTSGRPQVQFDGESTVSTRQFPYLSSYTPNAGDRVLVAAWSKSKVVLGKIM